VVTVITVLWLVVACGYLISYRKVLIYTTYIEKVIAKLYSVTVRKKITEKT